MPEAVTLTEQGTPALSEENQQMLEALNSESSDDEDQLLAGKYKSVEDLEKAYKELQTKLSQRPGDSVEDDGEVDDSDEEEQPEAGNAKEIYGDLIGGRLEDAGIDFDDMNTRWQQSGELSSDDYGQLQEAGFTKDMVDAYLSGLQYKAAQDTAMTVREITAIKQEFGGDKAYGEMLQWAADNLSPDEVEGFNQIVTSPTTSPSAVRMAISGLQARYSSANGREPKLIGGRSPKSSTEKFESAAQLVEAMKDSRYANDPAYRRKIEDKLSRSSIF